MIPWIRGRRGGSPTTSAQGRGNEVSRGPWLLGFPVMRRCLGLGIRGQISAQATSAVGFRGARNREPGVLRLRITIRTWTQQLCFVLVATAAAAADDTETDQLLLPRRSSHLECHLPSHPGSPRQALCAVRTPVRTINTRRQARGLAMTGQHVPVSCAHGGNHFQSWTTLHSHCSDRSRQRACKPGI